MYIAAEPISTAKAASVLLYRNECVECPTAYSNALGIVIIPEFHKSPKQRTTGDPGFTGIAVLSSLFQNVRVIELG